MAANKTDGARRAIGGCVALAVTAGMALAAYAQPATAPGSAKVPITAPTMRPSAVITTPYVVAISYPAPGQNPPAVSTSFGASALSFTQAEPASAVGRPATPASEVAVTVDIGSGSPPPAIPAQSALTSMTITEYKAGAVIMTMNFAGAVLVSRAFSPGAAGRPMETLTFVYQQVSYTR